MTRDEAMKVFRDAISAGQALAPFAGEEAAATVIQQAFAEKVAKAAIRAMLDGVENNLSAVQYDPAPYTAMKHRIAAMRKDVE